MLASEAASNGWRTGHPRALCSFAPLSRRLRVRRNAAPARGGSIPHSMGIAQLIAFAAGADAGKVPRLQEATMTESIFVFIAIGFVAQLVDGALGMAFGIISTSSLLAFGVPPATASAMTHVTEIFTTAASGASHAYHRNIDWRLVARLAPAGMIGGIVGAYILASADAGFIQPIVSLYLAGMGVFIIFKALRPLWPREIRDWIVPIVGAGGGLLDAMGGGGWGPIVTGSLIGRGHAPRTVIGSANLTEFLVTFAISATFVATLGWSQLSSAIGLIIGGVLAAPIGGFIVSRLPVRPLMVAVGLIIIATSLPRIF
jgi:uncharacterized membrane protein YfcA